jgi:hypothetical protein
MEAAISHTVGSLVQRLSHILLLLLPSLFRCLGQVGNGLLEEIGVVAPACFEDQLARRSAL